LYFSRSKKSIIYICKNTKQKVKIRSILRKIIQNLKISIKNQISENLKIKIIPDKIWFPKKDQDIIIFITKHRYLPLFIKFLHTKLPELNWPTIQINKAQTLYKLTIPGQNQNKIYNYLNQWKKENNISHRDCGQKDLYHPT